VTQSSHLDLLQSLDCQEFPCLGCSGFSCFFVDFVKAELLETCLSDLVFVLLAQQEMQYFFGCNVAVGENFPQFYGHLLMLLGRGFIYLDFYGVFEADGEMFLKIVKG